MHERPPPRNETPPEVAGDHTEGIRQYKAHTNSASSRVNTQGRIATVHPIRYALCRVCSAPRQSHGDLCDQCRTWSAIVHTVEYLARLVRQVRR